MCTTALQRRRNKIPVGATLGHRPHRPMESAPMTVTACNTTSLFSDSDPWRLPGRGFLVTAHVTHLVTWIIFLALPLLHVMARCTVDRDWFAVL